MLYGGKTYYKIGRTTNLGKRELALRTANPFLTMIAKKVSFRHEDEEKEIQRTLKTYLFALEWYELQDDQYQKVFYDFNFTEYSEKERAENIKSARLPIRHKSTKKYHTFKKAVKGAKGHIVNRWYYYYTDDNGKTIQRVCKDCRSRPEAENYIRNFTS